MSEILQSGYKNRLQAVIPAKGLLLSTDYLSCQSIKFESIYMEFAQHHHYHFEQEGASQP